MFVGRVDDLAHHVLDGFVSDTDTGGVDVTAAPEALGEFDDTDAAFASEVDPHDTFFPFGKEHGDPDTLEGEGDGDLVVDVLGAATRCQKILVVEIAVGDQAIPGDAGVVVDAAEQVEVGLILRAAEFFADVGDVGPGADQLGRDVEGIGTGGGEAEAGGVAMDACIEQ